MISSQFLARLGENERVTALELQSRNLEQRLSEMEHALRLAAAPRPRHQVYSRDTAAPQIKLHILSGEKPGAMDWDDQNDEQNLDQKWQRRLRILRRTARTADRLLPPITAFLICATALMLIIAAWPAIMAGLI